MNTTLSAGCGTSVSITPSTGPFSAGDVLTCDTDGNSEPSYQWTNSNGEVVSSTSTVTLPEGPFSLTCTATRNLYPPCSVSTSVSGIANSKYCQLLCHRYRLYHHHRPLYWEVLWTPVRDCNKKLSYRRETARRLPTWGEARTSSPSPPLLATSMHMVESETRNKRTSSVPSIKRTLRWIGHSRSFKVILVGADRNPERYVVVMCN